MKVLGVTWAHFNEPSVSRLVVRERFVMWACLFKAHAKKSS